MTNVSHVTLATLIICMTRVTIVQLAFSNASRGPCDLRDLRDSHELHDPCDPKHTVKSPSSYTIHTAASSGRRIDRPRPAYQLDSAALQDTLKNQTVQGRPAGGPYILISSQVSLPQFHMDCV